MGHVENKLRWCIEKAKKEGVKHRGLKVVTDANESVRNRRASEHLSKADHNLKVMIALIKLGFTDWAVNASFYTRYHCLLAILAKNGYESRNQECTFAAVESLIDAKKLSLDKKLLHKISFPEEEMEESALVQLREEFQYGIGKMVEEQKMKQLLEDTKEFINEVKSVLNK